ncbi:MAG TPA: TatD family hydrolase [Candidatus Kapabacteria bacterium]|nr:TatD family hydrolase [Candidatus Kapabacteria bacterium]
MIDTHCHLQTEQFNEDREQVIAEAMASGVEGFIVPAIDIESFDGTLALAKTHSNIWCGLGIHPHSSAEWNSEIRERIKEEVKGSDKIVAVGEIGLDYYYDFAPKDVQIKAFREQIELAQELDKPIIIHTRDSIDETLAIVDEMYAGRSKTSGFGQFHCFSGTPEQAERVVSLGFAVSFTGNITFKNSLLAPVIQVTPLESMLIETDSPYLAPAPHRGKRNSPALIGLVAKKIGELTNREITDIMRITTENAKRIFRFSSAALTVLLLLISFSTTQAQPGSKPPDSVMTQSRREAEELIRKQREELAKEQEKRRQDSVASALQEERERQLEIRQQITKDSIRAIERAKDEEKARLKAQQPIAWKAIGIGGGLGVGNLSELNQLSRRSLIPTSVLATSIQIGTQITRSIDFEISYNSFTVSDNLNPDRLYRTSDTTFPVYFDTSRPLPPAPYTFPTHESIRTSYLSFDFRFLINPRSPVKFYTGFGYTAVTITNTQDYYIANAPQPNQTPTGTIEKSFSRGGIKILFGGRYDLEIGDQFILSPFAQISAAFLFNGQEQALPFDFRTATDLITFTHLNVGATLYFGWFGVKRQ